MYWAALLATSLALAACGGYKAATTSHTTTGSGAFFALDAQHQRLVSDYEPVSRKLYDYEVAFRHRQSGVISRKALHAAALDLRTVVRTAIRRIKGDAATGGTATAKQLLLDALEARDRALGSLIARSDLPAYQRSWDRSAVLAREALTKLQDLRDRARLIPLPEDSVS